MVLKPHTPKRVPGIGKAGTFLCRQDDELTGRAVVAIRRRKLREAEAVLVTEEQALWGR